MNLQTNKHAIDHNVQPLICADVIRYYIHITSTSLYRNSNGKNNYPVGHVPNNFHHAEICYDTNGPTHQPFILSTQTCKTSRKEAKVRT